MEDCLRIRMAQRAVANELDDDDWDSDALLTTLMVSIDAMMDNSLNEALGRRRLSNVQYFHIGDDQEAENRD